MLRVLIDTSAYSQFLRGNSKVKDVIQAASHLYLSVVALGELRAGFQMGNQAERNERQLSAFLASPRVSVIPIDDETTPFYAEIYRSLRSEGKPIPSNDLWIAACAMQHGLTLLSLDAHFLNVRQILVRHIDK
jgi:predicted nucleic acid-binding protein